MKIITDPKIIAAWKETNWGEPQLLNKLDVDELRTVVCIGCWHGADDRKTRIIVHSL